MWRVNEGNWNGNAAKDMYEKGLAPALKAWGDKRRYLVVEDGDRKGNHQSGKGIAAKAKNKIHAMTLPPRTPSLIPLVFSIWAEVWKRMLKSSPKAMRQQKAS